MKNFKSRYKYFLVLMLLSIPSSWGLAWWSGWYSPNFQGSYSPTAYKHGQWNSTIGGLGTEVFGSEMQWNKTRADGLRKYSNQLQWISFCGYCYSFYTHDHSDMSGKLDAYAYATNFPSPKVDTDDDNNNGRWEEFEVTVQNQLFPKDNYPYAFHTYFRRTSSGSTGILYETPAISAWSVISGEFDTFKYDSFQSLTYSTSPGKIQQDSETIHIFQEDNLPIINFSTYKMFKDIDNLANNSAITIRSVKANYINLGETNSKNLWTIQVWGNKNTDYERVLNEIASDVGLNGFDKQIKLQFRGITAVITSQ